VVWYILVIIALAFAFDFINGFHDSANSIATIVGTRVLSPFAAVALAAAGNFGAILLMGNAVAKAVSAGFVVADVVTPTVVAAGLLGAIVWNIITWYFGIPSSSSHALIGGFSGAAVAKAGLAALVWGKKWVETLGAIALSPTLGALVGFVLMVTVINICARATPAGVDRFFRRGQLLSSAAMSVAHGSNDAQKTMGIIVGLLFAARGEFANATGWQHYLYVESIGHIPLWVILGAHFFIAFGTLVGGWRIVHTMGSRITRLKPVSGFAAETAGAAVILTASNLGIPVSTTHTITGAIVGVGATHRLSGVRWGIAGRIVWAWILTIPAAATIAAVAYLLLSQVAGA
jgi:PiT family inorganic phosphate transporter